jgi:zinc/manganese transport system substrate-binding protein
MNIVIKFGMALAMLALATGSLAACSSSAAGGASGAVSVVASTDVWGDVVAQVAGSLAGSKVQITSIITDPSADPHSYEASTRNELAISKADLIVENGGGYDDFVDRMRRSSGGSATLLDAVTISGKKPVAGELNEHVWYDFPTVAKVAERIARALSSADRADAGTYRANAAAFVTKLVALEASEASIRAAHRGDGAAITEPVPVYLLDACGLVDRTPPEFSRAIENGTGVSPRVLQQTLALFSAHRVRLLAYNEQTSGVETDDAVAAAKAAGIPVVGVTETLPAGRDYLTWMRAILSAVSSALR